ncbi:DNA-directed RNA polymerase subunit N [archaeon]|nr:DNA-directed RNA polymerase subunit N [archaeon]
MIIPVRCLSCGKPVAGLWEKYKERVSSGESAEKVLNDLGLDRYCCRALFLTHRDVLKKVARFRV